MVDSREIMLGETGGTRALGHSAAGPVPLPSPCSDSASSRAVT
jgi:hypothetical protein